MVIVSPQGLGLIRILQVWPLQTQDAARHSKENLPSNRRGTSQAPPREVNTFTSGTEWSKDIHIGWDPSTSKLL